MRNRRVGVLGGDPALFVDLALRGDGLDVTRVEAPEELVDLDVALVDLLPGQDATAVVCSIPVGPAVVLLSDDATGVPGAIVVQRPCSLTGLRDILTRTRAGQEAPEVVITLQDAPVPDAPVPAPTVTPPLDASVTAPAVLEVADDIVQLPTVEGWVRRLTEALDGARSPREFADVVAESVAREIDADHVALWHRDGDDYVVLGATGLSSGAEGMRLFPDHPVVQLARAGGGVLHRDEDHHGARAPGLPGSGSPAYAMVLLDEGAGPPDLVTMSGSSLPMSTVERVRELLVAIGSTLLVDEGQLA